MKIYLITVYDYISYDKFGCGVGVKHHIVSHGISEYGETIVLSQDTLDHYIQRNRAVYDRSVGEYYIQSFQPSG